MSYSNNNSNQIDELRFHKQQSPRSDTTLLGGMASPSRNGPSLHQDNRIVSMRRFTADSLCAPSIASITSQRGGQDAQDYGPSTFHKVQLLEKKKLVYERLREQKRRFEAEMQLLDIQQRREEQELAQMQEDLGRSSGTSRQSHQSEPTTPEYRESSSGFPSAFSRPNRYSASSLTSPPGLYNRPTRSGSQITSPQSNNLQPRLVMDEKPPSTSVLGSRSNSDEDDKAEAVRQDPTSHRSTNALNRYSMPVTKSRSGLHEISLDQTNTTRFLFGEDDATTSGGISNYLQMNATEDNFPILVRREDFPGLLSASSAALDLALSQSPGPEPSGWSTLVNRHRPSLSQQNVSINRTRPNGSTTSAKHKTNEATPRSRQSYRHSLDLKYQQTFVVPQENASQVTSPIKNSLNTPTKLTSTFTNNDVQGTRASTNGSSTPNNVSISHAQQYLHNHNASLGRIPPGAVSNRLNREGKTNESVGLRDGQNGGYQSIQSGLHASAPPFGPILTPMSQPPANTPLSPTSQQTYPAQQPFYNMQMLMSGIQNMNMGQTLYSNPYPYSSTQTYITPRVPSQTSPRDNQARVIQQRPMNRFANMSLESLGGEIYTICKDQHGCRYLQKKLEERNPDEVHQIWLETNKHVIELMTDPFGNYLCQKLLEYCNDNERTVLIENASRDLVRIALNQHGTRALQKMIEHITTQGQIETIIAALRYRVVELIQDLNGNHVIQKCLNKLTSHDAQFIFDAVGKHCVDVGTHRHGCCVLQRCIDHADGEQKAWLIRQISNNAYVLVQDPFGNYVVQYILDLNESIFTEPLVAMFKGRVGQLSKQKFSSNVIEKCLRCAQEASKDSLIEEMLQPSELDRLLRDSFANYVIQTALDYANLSMKTRLIEAIRPHLPAIRSTPYGRRIQAKIQGNEGRNTSNNGSTCPNDHNEPTQAPLRHQRGNSNVSSGVFMAPMSGPYLNNYGIPSPTGNNLHPSRPIQAAGPFPSSEQLASPQAGHQSYSYSYSNRPVHVSNDNENGNDVKNEIISDNWL
ncbi:unnamed protein product [Blumeria hordei]|uniref:PUM-HD domain-containing protein n=1 Tax=Blumeria hordei TaxID=2867405 RepID=A0A383USH0_BLUHO|nr:unnamed protein product [Blumeria hordei]